MSSQIFVLKLLVVVVWVVLEDYLQLYALVVLAFRECSAVLEAVFMMVWVLFSRGLGGFRMCLSTWILDLFFPQ